MLQQKQENTKVPGFKSASPLCLWCQVIYPRRSLTNISLLPGTRWRRHEPQTATGRWATGARAHGAKINTNIFTWFQHFSVWRSSAPKMTQRDRQKLRGRTHGTKDALKVQTYIRGHTQGTHSWDKRWIHTTQDTLTHHTHRKQLLCDFLFYILLRRLSELSAAFSPVFCCLLDILFILKVDMNYWLNCTESSDSSVGLRPVLHLVTSLPTLTHFESTFL